MPGRVSTPCQALPTRKHQPIYSITWEHCMQIEPISTRRDYRRTRAKLARLGLDGSGTFYLTDTLGRGRELYPGHREEWTEQRPQFAAGETWEDVITRLAATGGDLLLRVGGPGGKRRLF